MIEEKIATWALGWTMGILTVIAGDKLMANNAPPVEVEVLRAEQLLEMYQRGKADALRVSGMEPNFELEQSCLTLWATKQASDQ